MNDRFTRRVFRKLSEGAELSNTESAHLADCPICQRAARQAARFDSELFAALGGEHLEPLPADPRVAASAIPAGRPWIRVALSVLVVMLAVAAGIAGSGLLRASPRSAAPTTTLPCLEPRQAHGSPPAKALPDEQSVVPVGPMGDGFVVQFMSWRSDGARSWWCLLDANGGWSGIPLPGDLPDFVGATSDGHDLALTSSRDDMRSDTLVLTAPTTQPTVLDLTSSSDEDWLDDWSFWGHLAPIPGGGFLLAQGTRLAVVQGQQLTFRDMPAGLTPLAATSDPATWLVARADGRAADGVISGPRMLWREGDATATLLPSAGSRWLPTTGGLLWLRNGSAWSLLEADGSLASLPADDGSAYDTDIAPDGSMELVGNGCSSDRPQDCHVRLVDPRSGAQLVALPGMGAIVWGNGDDALFITQPHPGEGQQRIFRISGKQATQILLP